MKNLENVTKSDQNRALISSTLAFTVCFAVWTIFSIIGIKIKAELGLNDTQFGILVATPILTGSISRLFLGIWADQYGGRLVFVLQMLTTAVAALFLTLANSYEMYLLGALGLGLAGGSFAVGVTYVSAWYPNNKQGTALGIFGVGNVGAAVTNFAAPILLIAMGGEWRQVVLVYAGILITTAILFFLFSKTEPAHRDKNRPVKSFTEQLKPLKNLMVWRFSLYYFFVFGAYVALALWLPRYYMGAYGLELATAGLLAAVFALPGSVFRAYGGWLSDKVGARKVMYWTFIVALISTVIMSYPATDYSVAGIEGQIEFNITIPLWMFISLSVVLGFFMSLGKAAVFKHIPHYFPENVGSVGGIVGLIGGLGGFFLPITFGIMNDIIGVWTSCFMLLSLLIAIALGWMHFSIRQAEKEVHPDLAEPGFLPELRNIK
ncbi:MAG: NarK/NasA family nitrate transporter [Xanthomonadales bacterium]|nr:NarK/NasA family nitrate transporter [Xanthomonadales bacterium]